MKLIELWSAGTRPSVSFEIFPPRNPKQAENLGIALERMVGLEPDFISVTFGAGGTRREGSRELVETLQQRGVEVLAYFAGHGLGPDDIDGVLGTYRDMGVDNVLLIRGDEPHDLEDFAPHPDAPPHASDLVAHVRPRFGFCLGAAAYPEGHQHAESLDQDLAYAKLKVDRGAEFLVTQYCYDNAAFLDFQQRARAAGIDVPIVAGVMPVFSVKMMRNLASMCGASIPPALEAGLAALPEGDLPALHDHTVAFAVDQCRGLIEAGVAGLHFYTLNRAKLPARILGQLRADGLL
jgi:methylenetetrahydrofolate reductase (NADPH)